MRCMHMISRRVTALCAVVLLGTGCGGSGGGSGSTHATVPSITTQPASQSVTAPAGATFSVSASGTAPLSYQWRRGGSDIPGATGSRYATGPTVPADNGAAFSVAVTNLAGTMVSAAAILTVAAPPPGILSGKSLLHDSLQRTYLEYVPQGLPATAVPLVIVLHGGTESAAIAAGSTRATSVWRDIADLDKFVVVYPDGVDNNWHDCRSDSAIVGTADDVGFIDALITRVASEHAIDASRIYVTGASNGGMMTYRIAQELSARVAGVGAVIANLPVDPMASCHGAPQPLTVVIMNGTADALMPYLGGPVAGSADRGTVRSAQETLNYWLAVDGCTGLTTPAVENLPDLDPTDGSTVVRQTWGACRDGTRVVFFRVDGGGHTEPSRTVFTSGRQNHDVEGVAEIWRVLKTARR
jgi:polyhydroxybutyrate depolymerase